MAKAKLITSTEALAQRNALKSIISKETLIMTEVLIAILARLEDRQPKKKRKPSAWQKFLAAQMRDGLSVQKAGELWRERKSQKAAAKSA